jgi:hypothetical protein
VPPRDHASEFGVPARHELGFGFPLIAPGGFLLYGPPYEPIDYGELNQPPYDDRDTVAGAVPGASAPAGYPPACPSETVTIPAENGDELSIHIVRC